MEATKLLEHQHDEAEKLFMDLSDSRTATHRRRTTALELGRKLLAHMVIEQTIFYPAVVEVDQALIHEDYEEHHMARAQIMRLLDADFDDVSIDAKVTALKELIEHHVKEEENELFPKVRATCDEAMLRELGASMKKEFESLVTRQPRTLFACGEATDVLADVIDARSHSAGASA